MEQTLNQKLSLIQKEFKANKSKFNSFGKYNFRSAEDILEALKPFNEKYQVSFIITERIVSSFDSHSNFPPMLKSIATILDNNGVNKIKLLLAHLFVLYKVAHHTNTIRQLDKYMYLLILCLMYN